MIDISVILCCYNGRGRLLPTLEHLSAQKIREGVKWELVFVDNASTDRSAELAKEVWNECGGTIPLNVVREDVAGLIYARKRGVDEAKGEVVVFCDDDNWLQEDYIQRAYDTLVSNENYGAVGGQGVAVADVKIPSWFYEWGNEKSYACGKLAVRSGVVDNLFGAGMTVRRDTLVKVFRVPFVVTGRNGGEIMSGDDTEICQRIRLLGKELYYDEWLMYEHYMPEERLSRKYQEGLLRSFEQVYTLQLKYAAALTYRDRRGSLWMLLRRFGAILKRCDARSREKLHCFIVYGLRCKRFAMQSDLYIIQLLEELR